MRPPRAAAQPEDSPVDALFGKEVPGPVYGRVNDGVSPVGDDVWGDTLNNSSYQDMAKKMVRFQDQLRSPPTSEHLQRRQRPPSVESPAPTTGSSSSSTGSPLRNSAEDHLQPSTSSSAISAFGGGGGRKRNSHRGGVFFATSRSSPALVTGSAEKMSGTAACAAQATGKFRCLCGECSVVTGARLSLIFYIILTIGGMAFGMVSALVWTLIPLVVIPMAVYSLCRHKPKYLYPFLLITIVQMFVSLILALVVTVFSCIQFDALNVIIAHSVNGRPSPTLTLSAIATTVVLCLAFAVLLAWQILVIMSCIEYFECCTQRAKLPPVKPAGTGEQERPTASFGVTPPSRRQPAEGSTDSPLLIVPPRKVSTTAMPPVLQQQQTVQMSICSTGHSVMLQGGCLPTPKNSLCVPDSTTRIVPPIVPPLPFLDCKEFTL